MHLFFKGAHLLKIRSLTCLDNLRMGDLLVSFLRFARVRPNCGERACVGLWGQFAVSMGSHRRFGGAELIACLHLRGVGHIC